MGGFSEGAILGLGQDITKGTQVVSQGKKKWGVLKSLKISDLNNISEEFIPF